jgi:hypothetical protein
MRGVAALLSMRNIGPHPEERRLRRVSKDGQRRDSWPSFETLASQAPQDEVFETRAKGALLQR